MSESKFKKIFLSSPFLYSCLNPLAKELDLKFNDRLKELDLIYSNIGFWKGAWLGLFNEFSDYRPNVKKHILNAKKIIENKENQRKYLKNFLIKNIVTCEAKTAKESYFYNNQAIFGLSIEFPDTKISDKILNIEMPALKIEMNISFLDIGINSAKGILTETNTEKILYFKDFDNRIYVGEYFEGTPEEYHKYKKSVLITNIKQELSRQLEPQIKAELKNKWENYTIFKDQVKKELSKRLEPQIRGQIKLQLENSAELFAELRIELKYELKDNTLEIMKIESEVKEELKLELYTPVRKELKIELEKSITEMANIKAELQKELEPQVKKELESKFRQGLEKKLEPEVKNSLKDKLKFEVWQSLENELKGNPTKRKETGFEYYLKSLTTLLEEDKTSGILKKYTKNELSEFYLKFKDKLKGLNIKIEQLEIIPEDFLRLNQVEALLGVYAEKIKKIKQDDSLDEEDKDEQINYWKELRDKHINEIKGE